MLSLLCATTAGVHVTTLGKRKLFFEDSWICPGDKGYADNESILPPPSYSFVTAGFQSKHREGHEKISDIYGPKQREGQAYRFKRREMMGVAIWPKGYEEAQKARQAKCFTGPKPYPGYEKFYEERENTIREAYEAKIKKAEEDRIRREEEDKPIDIVELNKRQAHLLVPKKEPEDEPKEEDNKVNASGEEKLKAVEEEDATEEHSSLAAKEPSSSAAEEPEASEKSK